VAKNQKYWGRVATVPFTASANRAAGDLVHEGLNYGVVVDTTLNGAGGMLHVRDGFELTKNAATEVLAVGDFVEFVTGGKVQKHDEGVKIGKVVEASGNGTTTVIVDLMPELY
jgi:predicted RecA/RadA family phage recombinase